LATDSFHLLPLAAAPGFGAAAEALASRRGLTWLGERDDTRDDSIPLLLWFDDSGLSIRHTGRKAMGPVRCDFVGGESRHRRLYGGGKAQAIAKAVGVRERAGLRVADLTAGMGGDAFALAGLGCELILVERHPVVAALLADGLRRAAAAAEMAEEGSDDGLAAVVGRITLVEADARRWLADLAGEQRPDVIYLDPMFPERRKSAQVNKAMQVFHQLVGADNDADDLLPLALEKARHRVVIKRPSHAPWLEGRKPSYALEGKAVRFDIHALRRISDT